MFFYIYYGLYLHCYICNWRKLKDGPRFRLAMWKFQVSFAFNCVIFSFVIKLSWDIVLPKFILLSYQKKKKIYTIMYLSLKTMLIEAFQTQNRCHVWELIFILDHIHMYAFVCASFVYFIFSVELWC